MKSERSEGAMSTRTQVRRSYVKKSTKKGTPSCAGGRGGGAAEGFEVACSVRPPGPGSKQTCPYLEANPARVEGQPGPDARRTRPGSRVNPGRMRGEPGPGRGSTRGGCEKRGGRRCPPEAAPPGVPASLLAGKVQPGCEAAPGRGVREAAAGLPSPSPSVAKRALSAVRCPLRARFSACTFRRCAV